MYRNLSSQGTVWYGTVRYGTVNDPARSFKSAVCAVWRYMPHPCITNNSPFLSLRLLPNTQKHVSPLFCSFNKKNKKESVAVSYHTEVYPILCYTSIISYPLRPKTCTRYKTVVLVVSIIVAIRQDNENSQNSNQPPTKRRKRSRSSALI